MDEILIVTLFFVAEIFLMAQQSSLEDYPISLPRTHIGKIHSSYNFKLITDEIIQRLKQVDTIDLAKSEKHDFYSVYIFNQLISN